MAGLETYCILFELALRNWMTARMEMNMNSKKKLPSDQRRVRSVNQSRLSHATVCFPALREPRFDGKKQASCHSRLTKVLEKNKNNRTEFSMQQHVLIYSTHNNCTFN